MSSSVFLPPALANILHPGYVRQIGIFRWLWRYPLWQLTKRTGSGPIPLRLPHGRQIRLPRGSQFSSALFLPRGFVDWGCELATVKMMRPGQVFLDVGAHFGYYSLLAAAEGMQCIAFEPDPRNEVLFREATSGVSGIELRRAAVADAPGQATFVQNAASSAMSHLADTRGDTGSGVLVDVTTVDQVVNEEDLDVGAIKIDVEGFDHQVLRGAQHTLRVRRPLICTESMWDGRMTALAQSVHYRVGAICQDAAGRRSLKFRLPMDAEVCPMLFLVPHERTEELAEVVSGILQTYPS